jgi:hypothetical protein
MNGGVAEVPRIAATPRPWDDGRVMGAPGFTPP